MSGLNSTPVTVTGSYVPSRLCLAIFARSL